MVRYGLLQCKRIAKALPGVFLAAAVLLGGLLAVFSLTTGSDTQDRKFRVGLVGTAGDSFMQMGLAALETFDSSQLSMELVEMTEAQARAELEKGTIGAYILIPENFVAEAMNGRIIPLKFVSTVGAAGLVSVFKEEVTRVVSLLVLQSQRGVYGMQAAMKEAGLKGRGDRMDELAFTMVEYILVRDRTYRLTELGVADAMDLSEYLRCGLWVLFLLLCCLPFAPLMIRRDLSLNRMLAAKGRGLWVQALWEFGVYFLGLLAVTALIGALAGSSGFPLRHLVPVVLLAAAMSFALYALSSDLIGGVLAQFFCALCVCFVSGCMYPVHFFPLPVQRLARWLPTGAARDVLAGEDRRALALTLAYSVLLALVGLTARVRAGKEARV